MGLIHNIFRNMLLHFGFGVLSVVFFVLHLIWDVPIFLTVLAILFWVLQAFVHSVRIGTTSNRQYKSEKIKENKNPYSLKTEDILPSAKREAEEKAYNEKLVLEALELKLTEAEKMLSILDFCETEKVALLDALRAEKNASPRRLLELLSQNGTLVYATEKQSYCEIAYKVDSSAKKAGLSFIPAELMNSISDLQGMRAVEYLAAGIKEWSVFAILDNTEFGNGFYVGCTTNESLSNLLAQMQDYLRGEYDVIACGQSDNQ